MKSYIDNEKISELVILSLDQSSNKTGYSIYKNGNIIKYGTFQTNKEDKEKSFFNQIDDLIYYNKVNLLLMEDVYKKAHFNDYNKTFGTLSKFQGIALAAALANDIPFEVIDCNRVRAKYITRYHEWNLTRTVCKQRAIEKVQRWGYDIKDTEDDTADSILQLMYYLSDNSFEIIHPNMI